MDLKPGQPVRIKLVTAGDEYSLEEKVNEVLTGLKPTECLVDLKIVQVEYHNRSGGLDTALLASLLIKS
jgi:hypothetical protein